MTGYNNIIIILLSNYVKLIGENTVTVSDELITDTNLTYLSFRKEPRLLKLLVAFTQILKKVSLWLK